jgi:hypothetical protein
MKFLKLFSGFDKGKPEYRKLKTEEASALENSYD